MSPAIRESPESHPIGGLVLTLEQPVRQKWRELFEAPDQPADVSVIECFETDGGVNYRSDWLIFFNLCGFRLMLQATFLDGVPFDPFSFQQDSWATSEVDVGRR